MMVGSLIVNNHSQHLSNLFLAKMIFQAGNLMTELLTTILFRYAYHTITPIIKTTLKQLMKISNLSDLNVIII